MFPTTLVLVLAIFFLNSALSVDAGLYVVKPSAASKCHGGQKCTVEWLDDGVRPLLSAIGVCRVGLYTGRQQLVQELTPVDVSNTRSMTFTPNPHAGPNSDTYYISIISTSSEQFDHMPYTAYSPFFSLDQMSGSFQSPVASATSTKPLPSSLTHSGSPAGNEGSILSTITIGTLSTSLPTPNASPSTWLSSSSTSTATPVSSPSPTRMTKSTSPSASSSRTSTWSSSFTSSPSTSPTSSSTSTSTSTSTSISGAGTGTTTGSGTSSVVPPAASSLSSGAVGFVPIPILSAVSLPLLLFILL